MKLFKEIGIRNKILSGANILKALKKLGKLETFKLGNLKTLKP